MNIQEINIKLADIIIPNNEKLEIIGLIKRVFREVNIKDYTSVDIENLNSTLDSGYLFSPRIVSFIARDNNKIVGVLSATKRTGVIIAAYVDPLYSNQGIGSRLLKKIENYLAKEKSTQYIWLTCSLTATIFFRNRGYKIIARKVKTTGRLTVNLMGKKLIDKHPLKFLSKEIKLNITYRFFTLLMYLKLMS